jgi:TolA-binding protein
MRIVSPSIGRNIRKEKKVLVLKKIYIFYFLIIIATLPCVAQESKESAELSEGMQYFQRGQFQQAIVNFRNIILDPAQEKYHGDAFFWLARTYIVLEQLDDAERSLESFLLNYPDHVYYSEALYLKGRLLFMQDELENSIQVFQNFINTYPKSKFVPNAYFWVGEALFLLGNFDSSMKIFQVLLQQYPQSVKIEAAKYRIDLIKLKRRENELLKLLKMSHEELLKTLEEFQKKERTYEQAIAAYQKKLAASGQADRDKEILRLQEQLQKKEKEIADLSRLTECERKLSEKTSSTGVGEKITPGAKTATTDMKELKRGERLLNAKEEALFLKAQLLQAQTQQ